MAISNGNWWDRGTPLTDYSSIQSSDIGGEQIGATALDSTTKSYIPGVAVIGCSTHSSNDEYDVTVQLYDVGGNAWARRQHVRVYLSGSTGDAGGAVASSAAARINVKSSASTDVFSSISTINTGVAASTHTAALDLDFLTASDGTLTINIDYSSDDATTHCVVLDWIGGVVRSSGTIGTTLASTS